MNATPWKQTPIHALHQALGATMTAFAGYEMPVRYAPGIINEHLHTRAKAGLFDVSHMGQIVIEGGADVSVLLETLVPSDILGLAPGAMRYTLLLNERGGILDDLMVARPFADANRLWLVVNASGKERDIKHLRERLADKAAVTLLEDRALLALQGPLAAAVLARFCTAPQQLRFLQCGEFTLTGFGTALISRSGYTGEDGFEISLPATRADEFARALLLHAEVMMVGLGARDSLRLEAGLPLYGHDLDEATTPVEAGLAWVIAKRRLESGDYPGHDIIRHELLLGPARRRVGIRPHGKAIAREATQIHFEDRAIGEVSSGGFGPSLSAPIAVGYVASAYAAIGTPLDLVVRGNAIPAQIVPLPFVPHRYQR